MKKYGSYMRKIYIMSTFTDTYNLRVMVTSFNVPSYNCPAKDGQLAKLKTASQNKYIHEGGILFIILAQF